MYLFNFWESHHDENNRERKFVKKRTHFLKSLDGLPAHFAAMVRDWGLWYHGVYVTGTAKTMATGRDEILNCLCNTSGVGPFWIFNTFSCHRILLHFLHKTICNKLLWSYGMFLKLTSWYEIMNHNFSS